ncbi:MAG: hypothetical protein LBT46_15460 [Planctomycetaceae bacterium]|jgi:hypothetical protein|nr:hypothetical protein [Planctomycetaceae bacterium]
MTEETQQFTSGWLPEKEAEDLKALEAQQEVCGQKFLFDWDEVKSRIYAEAEHYQDWLPQSLPPVYNQNSSNACAAISNAYACYYLMQLEAAKRHEVTPFMPFPAWTYMIYHAQIAKDHNYGGCSLAGMLTANSKYGILPTAAYGKSITDKEMVALRWNTRVTAAEVYEKYSGQAERWQIKVTRPKTFEDIRACLRAGYPVNYGTSVQLGLNKSGEYVPNGTTAHAMTWAYYRAGYFGMTNSWNDGFGWEKEDYVKKQLNGRYFDCFALIGIERDETAKPDWSL